MRHDSGGLVVTSRRAALVALGSMAGSSIRLFAPAPLAGSAAHRPEHQEPQEAAGGSVGRLSRPWDAGRPRARVTAMDNDPFIVDVEKRLKCNCGCSHSLYVCRTTDFNCEFWQPLHAEVIAMTQEEMTAEEIIDAYVAKHGEQYRMAPAPRGFNVAAYLVPGFLIAAVGSALVWFVARRTRISALETPAESTPTALTDRDVARLEAELDKLDA